MGSAAVGELGTLLREKVFLVFFKKKKKKNHNPGHHNVHRELAADAGWCGERRQGGWRDQAWRNKSRDKLLLVLKHLSFFFFIQKNKTKPGNRDNSVVQSAH